MFSHPSLASATTAFERACVKAPFSHTTLYEVRRRNSGNLIAYQVLTSLYATPIPQPRGEFLIPIRQA